MSTTSLGENYIDKNQQNYGIRKLKTTSLKALIFTFLNESPSKKDNKNNKIKMNNRKGKIFWSVEHLNQPFSICRDRSRPNRRSRYSRRRVLEVTPRWDSLSHHRKTILHKSISINKTQLVKHPIPQITQNPRITQWKKPNIYNKTQ